MEKFIKQTILPSFTNGYQYKNPDETKIWLGTVLLPDRELQKLLFRNQFDLKKVFDKVCRD